MKWVNSYSALLKEANKKDVYILTAFGFFIGVTKRDLKLSIGDRKFKYLIDNDYNVIYIKKMVRL